MGVQYADADLPQLRGMVTLRLHQVQQLLPARRLSCGDMLIDAVLGHVLHLHLLKTTEHLRPAVQELPRRLLTRTLWRDDLGATRSQVKHRIDRRQNEDMLAPQL